MSKRPGFLFFLFTVVPVMVAVVIVVLQRGAFTTLLAGAAFLPSNCAFTGIILAGLLLLAFVMFTGAHAFDRSAVSAFL